MKTPQKEGQLKVLRAGAHKQCSSSIPKFYAKPMHERQQILAEHTGLDLDYIQTGTELCQDRLDHFVENAVGSFALPLGIATNFTINGEDVLVPMAVEESSVIAAASLGAKLARSGGGFTCSSTRPVLSCQVELRFDHEPADYDEKLATHKARLIKLANTQCAGMVARGGGTLDIELRYVAEIKSLVFYFFVDTRDAMGANIINSIAEFIAPHLQELFGGDVGLQIVSNLSDRRMASAECEIPVEVFKSKTRTGHDVAERIERAYLLAKHDIYRASTHNKGVMNGIDAVVIATGNDWRAIEAGAHAFCAKNGGYEPMTKWKVREKSGKFFLHGSIHLPMALGTVGGVTKLHPKAKLAMDILGQPSSGQLAKVAVAVGLAQNLAALRALSSEGIQQGHMALHQKNFALSSTTATDKTEAAQPNEH